MRSSAFATGFAELRHHVNVGRRLGVDLHARTQALQPLGDDALTGLQALAAQPGVADGAPLLPLARIGDAILAPHPDDSLTARVAAHALLRHKEIGKAS